MRALAALAALSTPLLLGGCSLSLGEGEGDVKSDALFAHDCWGEITSTGEARGDGYDLQPTFFAAIPYRDTLLIRVQRGNDIQEVSDGLLVLVDDVPKIRAAIDEAKKNGTGPAKFRVAVPAGVSPPGSPTVAPEELQADPPLVHVALYLHRSCHNQNTVLYGVSGSVSFTSLFSGDPNEESGEQKLTDATFDVQVGDLRDVPLGGYPTDIPADLQSQITGNFQFFFQRGQPAQPFP